MASLVTAIGGGLVLIGWLLDVGLLKQVLPNAATMKPNTAIGFILLGTSLWLQQHYAGRSKHSSSKRKVTVRACASIAVLLGLLTLAEYLIGIDIGIDDVLFSGDFSSSESARMAPASAFGFVVLGLAVLLLNTETQRGFRPSQFLALMATMIGLIAVTGYVYGVEALYRFFPYSSVAPHTALFFTLLGLGVLFAKPDCGLMGAITSPRFGGLMARRILPAALLLPFLVGWLRLEGENAGLYGTEFGLAIFVTVIIVILAGVIWLGARSLNRMDAQRHDVDEQLRMSEERLRLAVTGAGIGTWHWDIASNKIVWSDRCCALFGYPAGEALNYEKFLACLHPADRPRVDAAVKRALADRADYNVEFRIIWPDGSEHWITGKGRGYYNVTGDAFRMEGVAIDITERKKAEAELIASREELRELSANTQAMREAEKTRIARELHDDLGQQLTGLKMDLAALNTLLPQDNASLQSKIQTMRSLLTATITSVRRIAADLRPVMLDELGLAAAIDWLAQDFSKRYGIKVELHLSEEELALDGTIGTALFRIIQEALTNVARHAKATAVKIVLTYDNRQCVVSIEDNGIGMASDAQRKPKSFGLLGMRERVQLLQGHFIVESAVHKGTLIQIVVPTPTYTITTANA